MILLTDYLARIGCAFLMGTLIGVERQFRQRNAGLRTNILVSVGAAAFTVLSYAMTAEEGDPSRVAAQIVSGIGFLGGGLILKDGFTVRGLNTAATIWCSAACGTLSGVGLYREAAILVACIQKLITDTLAFDKNVKLNSLFYKGDEERVTVCCNMETLGEHKALLDLLVSRLRSRSEVYSAGWEKKEAPQEDF